MTGGIRRAGLNRFTEGRDRAIRQGRAGRQGIGLSYDSRLHDDAFKRRRRLEIGTLDTAISATCQHQGGQRAQKAHGLDRSEEHTSELQSLMRISYAGLFLTKQKHKPLEDIYCAHKTNKIIQ